MIYDRQLTISTASNRHAKNWAPQRLFWSEMLQRLAVPVRGQETLAAYLRMPKASQDDLKDVGGYVGGELNSSRRKNNAVVGRDIITLDLDAVPAGATDDLLRRVSSLGCAWAAYSTRKHEPGRPRLRVLLPLNRTVTADEYEPIARKAAELIAIDWCDPTTFQPVRLMYWPSCSADSLYVFVYEDKLPIDADGLLSMYANWRDVTTWPQVPGHKVQQALAEKQEDPTTKPGIVGAFCRQYNVYQAMDQFIPGAYEPVDNSADRYTFTGGSTTGGAVIYENGNFLFSHHATDPAGGKLVNSFDLVRLHLYAALDEEAKEGTPVAKLPSYERMKQLAVADPQVKKAIHEERYAQVMEDFGGARDGATLPPAEFLGALDKKMLTTGLVRDMIRHLGVTIRGNVISGQVELKGCPVEWSNENAVNNFPVYISDLLRPAGVKGVSKNSVCDCLDIIADENRYNPVADMFKENAWDGRDRCAAIFAILGVQQPFDQLLIYKWLLQTAAMACNDPSNPWGAEGVLVLQSGQGIGKTSFFRCICPIPELFKEGADLDPKNKDTLIQASSSWICELGELERTTKRDHASLKAILTAEFDHYRAPYARTAVRKIRRTSFCGTVNPGEYLIDDTGNRRFWTVPVLHIDLQTLFNLPREWKLQLWAQMYHAFLTSPQSFRLTAAERQQLEERNRPFTKPLDYELEVRALLEYTIPEADWKQFRAADVATKIMPHPPANRVGRVLTKLAKEDPRITAKSVHNSTVYRLPIRVCAPYSADFSPCVGTFPTQ